MTTPDAVPTHHALRRATVGEAVHALRPDYRALLITVTGLRGGPCDEGSEAALARAEATGRERLQGGPVESLPEVAAWREALLGFGIKPRQARSSLEALLRRVEAGLPRINRLTDLYNAVSVEHLVPIGGEDLSAYVGPPRLVRAVGDEPFDTVADGQAVTVTPDPGEVVWRDDLGVTCRRWNWRQCVRTRLDEDTTDALFVLDALGPTHDAALRAAAEALVGAVAQGSPTARVATRLLAPGEVA